MQFERLSFESEEPYYHGNLTPLVLRKNTLPDSALREWVIEIESQRETSVIHYSSYSGHDYALELTRDATEVGEVSYIQQEMSDFTRLHKLAVKTLGLADGVGPILARTMTEHCLPFSQYESSFRGDQPLSQRKLERLYTQVGKLKDQKVVRFEGLYVGSNEEIDELEAIIDACYATEE